MNAAIQEMVKTPGFYWVAHPFVWLVLGRYALVEVDEHGVVYQIDPNNQRDGVLDNEGWDEDVIVMTPKTDHRETIQ